MTETTRLRHLPFEGPRNFRDVGGYTTRSGKTTRWGRLYRSDALWRLTPEDLLALEELHIRTIIDLRNADECERHPNPVASQHTPIESTVSDLSWKDLPLVEAADAEAWLNSMYFGIVRAAGPLFGTLVTGIAAGELPMLVHCAGGKDRTGLVVAVILDSLGVDRETVLDDYELSNDARTAVRRAEALELFVGSGMTREAARGLLTAHRHVMQATLEMLDTELGGAEAFLRREGGVSAEVMGCLADQLLE